MKNLLKNAYNLPWKYNDAPHAILDIIRGCNIKCNACYNSAECKIKTFDEVVEDYKKIISVRKISSIAIIGGEPLLNPDLIEIIKFLKEEGLSVELFSNGLLLDEDKVKELAQAGVDLVFLHIDIGQNRKDLPQDYTITDADRLRTQKAQMLYNYGIEVAMSITVKKDDFGENLDNYLNYFKESKFINYFLITLYRDITSYGKLNGILNQEVKGQEKQSFNSQEPSMQEIMEYLNEQNLEPYTYLTGHYNKELPRWVCYQYAASYKYDTLKYTQNIKNSKFERFYLKRIKEKTGVYPFFTKQDCIINSIYMLMNALCGGYLWGNISYLFKSWDKWKKIKRILIQEPASVNSDGNLEFCESCPDITVRNGKIVPVCVCDNFD
ncbi:radical SAM protein [bacterium]|nr:radical SAM protein [bacterium]